MQREIDIFTNSMVSRFNVSKDRAEEFVKSIVRACYCQNEIDKQPTPEIKPVSKPVYNIHKDDDQEACEGCSA